MSDDHPDHGPAEQSGPADGYHPERPTYAAADQSHGGGDNPMKRRLRIPPCGGLVTLLVAAVLLGASCPASAGIRGALAASRIAAAGPITLVRACSALPHMNFGSVPDAPGKVTSAVVVHGTPACQTRVVLRRQRHLRAEVSFRDQAAGRHLARPRTTTPPSSTPWAVSAPARPSPGST
jgi:hypothetical protein